MNRKELLKRYLLFLIGLCVTSFGIAFVTKANLGTSPISAIPYSLSLIVPQFSMGNWTIVFSLLLIVLQIVMLRQNANKLNLLAQFVVSFAFGYFIDLSTLCLGSFSPTVYGIQIVSLLFGCCFIALGVYFQLIANVVMLPGDAFVCTVTNVLRKEYGSVRVCSDVSMAVIAAILCLLFLHEFSGVREGTILSALVVGNVIKFITKKLERFTYFILPENRPAEPSSFDTRSQSVPN